MKVEKVLRYGVEAWAQPTLEAARRELCLCLNCRFLRPDHEDNCRIAHRVFEICKSEGVALAMTRCPVYEEKE